MTQNEFSVCKAEKGDDAVASLTDDNRLEHTIANPDNVVEHTTAAEFRIRDTDVAEEMVEYSKNILIPNILTGAGFSKAANVQSVIRILLGS